MRKIKFTTIFFVAIVISIFFAGINTAIAKDSDFIEAFREALYAGDNDKMAEIISDNRDNIPAEVDGYIPATKDEAIDASERETRFFLLEMITTIYKEETRDPEPLKAFKRAYFESKLSAPIRSVKKGGVHHVEFVMPMGDVRDKFSPDNIIIEAGDTVRWTNTNKIAHLFATSMFIGEKGIFTPSIKPGETWDYTFTKPGEYYLICFVHVGMIAKVKVLGAEEPEEEPIPEETEEAEEVEESLTPISDGIPMEAVESRETDADDMMTPVVMPLVIPPTLTHKEEIEDEGADVDFGEPVTNSESEPLAEGVEEAVSDIKEDDAEYEFMDGDDGFMDDDLDGEELIFEGFDEEDLDEELLEE